MQAERDETLVSKVFRPYSSIPENDDYDFDKYLNVIVDNLRGPIRQFRSKMLDLGNLMCVDPDQRKVFRDIVFQAERDITELIEKWASFYGLDSEEVQDAIYAWHEGDAS